MKKTESIMFFQPLDRPVEAWFMAHPSCRIGCMVYGFVGTPEGAWANIDIDGEKTLVPIHTVVVDEEMEQS